MSRAKLPIWIKMEGQWGGRGVGGESIHDEQKERRKGEEEKG
jgi:hypothetical protein